MQEKGKAENEKRRNELEGKWQVEKMNTEGGNNMQTKRREEEGETDTETEETAIERKEVQGWQRLTQRDEKKMNCLTSQIWKENVAYFQNSPFYL